MTAKDASIDARDWLLLGLLSILWGGSFFFNGVVLKELPPFTLVFLRVCRPKRNWRFPEEREKSPALAGAEKEVVKAATGEEWQVGSGHPAGQFTHYAGGQIARAWMPFLRACVALVRLAAHTPMPGYFATYFL